MTFLYAAIIILVISITCGLIIYFHHQWHDPADIGACLIIGVLSFCAFSMFSIIADSAYYKSIVETQGITEKHFELESETFYPIAATKENEYIYYDVQNSTYSFIYTDNSGVPIQVTETNPLCITIKVAANDKIHVTKQDWSKRNKFFKHLDNITFTDYIIYIPSKDCIIFTNIETQREVP